MPHMIFLPGDNPPLRILSIPGVFCFCQQRLLFDGQGRSKVKTSAARKMNALTDRFQTGLDRMRIAVLSDTHSRYQTVEKALALLRDLEINWIVHCGDIEDAETVRLFKGFTTHFVFGNCDWDKAGLQIAMQEMGFTL